MSREAKVKYLSALKEQLLRKSRSDLLHFTLATMPTFRPAQFHRQYYSVLTDFANGDIQKLMVFMPPQHGKALPIDTPILTTQGWKAHGDLQPGDYVFGDNGKPKKVLRNWGTYEWDTMRINFADGGSIECAPEHLWKIYSDYDDHKGRREEIKEAQEIFGHRHRRSPYIMADACLDTPDKELPIDPYILGLWLGDGLSRQGVIISGEKDASHYAKIGEVRNVGKGQFRVLVKGLSKSLRLAGLICNKHIPIEYMTASAPQRWALLQGLMDTDGCVDKHGRCEFTQKAGQVAEDVYVLMRTLGLKPTKHSYVAKLNGTVVGIKTRLCFSPNKNQTVFLLERKQSRIAGKVEVDREDKRKFFISSIEPSERQKVNCIQVEGGMYLAGRELFPTHNSEGSTRRLPAFVLGKDPDKKVAIVSYSAPKARKFNREIQRVIDNPDYAEIFPETRLNSSNVTTIAGSWLRNADECEIVGHRGGFKTVGVGGALTGDPVDMLIMDDLYKDAATAWSPVVRAGIADWYDTVAETRLHNDSQQLIVFTRWHQDDLAGILLRTQGEYDELLNPDGWVVVKYEAIKEGEPTQYDSRQHGEALWEERHSLHKLKLARERNPLVFASLYQQNPQPAEGLMYREFKTYEVIPPCRGVRRMCYTDTADTGADYLCAICYEEHPDANYVVDVLYSKKPMEFTEQSLAQMLAKRKIQHCIIESNNGGRAFMRNVERLTRLYGNNLTYFQPYTQTKNKQVRIFTMSAEVNNLVVFPHNWETRWPEFAQSVKGYLKEGSNAHDDSVDALTGTVEHRGAYSEINEAEIFQDFL